MGRQAHGCRPAGPWILAVSPGPSWSSPRVDRQA
jgi:hypothetical protein